MVTTATLASELKLTHLTKCLDTDRKSLLKQNIFWGGEDISKCQIPWQVYVLNYKEKLRKHFLKQFRLFLELLLFLIFYNHRSHSYVARSSTHARAPCQVFVFQAQCGIYKYINTYIMSVQVRKKHILCALYFGETIKLVIFCMMKP